MVSDTQEDALSQVTDQLCEDPAKEQTTAPKGQGKPRKKHKSMWYDLGMLGVKIGAVILVGVALFTFVFGLQYNQDPSMEPALKDGDLVVFYRWNKDYIARDLVVLNYEGEMQVRRVIAVAGDTVDITEEGLIINGSLQQERDIFFHTVRYAEGADFPLTLKEGEVFLLGDARENVVDSRIYGAVSVDDTEGQVMTIMRRRNL